MSYFRRFCDLRPMPIRSDPIRPRNFIVAADADLPNSKWRKLTKKVSLPTWLVRYSHLNLLRISVPVLRCNFHTYCSNSLSLSSTQRALHRSIPLDLLANMSNGAECHRKSSNSLDRYAGHPEFPQGDLAHAITNQSAMEMPKSLVHECIFIGVVCAAQFMTQAGLALAIVPLHIIGESFHVSNAGQLSWYAAAYSLTVGTFILIAGRLGDLYGHRLMFIGGFAWFGLWSLLGGFSVWSNQIFFDICRAFQGIGPAFLLPNALAILGRTYPPGPRKDMVFSIFGATAPGGFAVGGAFSALLAQRAWWPWGYWIMGIVCITFAIFGFFAIPHSQSPELSSDTPWWVKCDLVGGLLGVAALILINFAWNQGPSVGWPTVYVYVLLIIGFLCLALFLWTELHTSCPLLPREIFSEDVACVLGCIAAGWSSFGVVVFYFFQFLEVIKGEAPLLVIAKWAPSAVSGAIAAVTTGFVLARLRPSVIMLIAMLAFTGGQILLATLPVHQTYWAQAFVISILTPWGM